MILQIYETARKRADQVNLPCAGLITPEEAYFLLQADSRVKLVDVRTRAELDWVGRVSIPKTQCVEVQWNFYPDRVLNENFLEQLGRAVEKDDVLLFLCRSGGRSSHASVEAAKNGFQYCFNILGGFEGDKDEFEHRKTVNGWCQSGLPWISA